MSISQRTAILALVLCGTLGCVTSGTHDRVLRERDTLRSHSAALSGDKQALEERVAALEASNASLAGELSHSKETVNDLTGTYDALLSELQTEVSAGRIEIEQMRDGIHLNVANDVLFESGSAEVDEGGREVMRKVAGQLISVPNAIRVDGHTDDVPIHGALAGHFPTNWELAGARATSVVRLLQEQGIAGTRMRAVSSGEFAPRVPNDSDESRAKNRRIEIRLLPHAAGGQSEDEVAEEAPDSEEGTATNPASPTES